VAAGSSTAAGLGAERMGGDGGVTRRRRESFSAALDRRQVGGGSKSPGTAARPGARRAPASSNWEANCWETMSRREREVVWIFSGKKGGFL
jgi:hypothetical protein